MDTCEVAICTLYHVIIWTCVRLNVFLYRTIEYDHLYEKLVQDAACQYRHMWCDICYLLPRDYINMCQIESCPISHACIWICAWWKFAQSSTSIDTCPKRASTNHHLRIWIHVRIKCVQALVSRGYLWDESVYSINSNKLERCEVKLGTLWNDKTSYQIFSLLIQWFICRQGREAACTVRYWRGGANR